MFLLWESFRHAPGARAHNHHRARRRNAATSRTMTGAHGKHAENVCVLQVFWLQRNLTEGNKIYKNRTCFKYTEKTLWFCVHF